MFLVMLPSLSLLRTQTTVKTHDVVPWRVAYQCVPWRWWPDCSCPAPALGWSLDQIGLRRRRAWSPHRTWNKVVVKEKKYRVPVKEYRCSYRDYSSICGAKNRWDHSAQTWSALATQPLMWVNFVWGIWRWPFRGSFSQSPCLARLEENVTCAPWKNLIKAKPSTWC